jgi:[acyl-carrier-protein] S-malonyltransferase
MGLELYKASAAAREVFHEADSALGIHLSRLVFEGPDAELQDTANCQPAIMTVSIACWKACEELVGSEMPRPVSVAGHSLGEYTSLVVAGVVSFSDGVKLVLERGRLMRQASEERPGGMAAIIGLDQWVLEEVCQETGVELGNINSDEQIVLSGDRLAVARAMDLASARGARKTIPLSVSGAFHSSLMSNVQQGLAEAIDRLDLRDPKIPIIANSNCLPLTTADQIRAELTHGLCQCVRWKDSVRYMVSSGVSHFIEFGPSRVLTSLIKRIDPSVRVATLSDPVSIRRMAEASL